MARALALNPSLIILDEPVSALDVSIRAQIMNLLRELQEEFNISYLIIAHDLATVRFMSHSVAIMYLGQIVEYAEAEELFENPLHPYTRALISASAMSAAERERERIILREKCPRPLILLPAAASIPAAVWQLTFVQMRRRRRNGLAVILSPVTGRKKRKL